MKNANRIIFASTLLLCIFKPAQAEIVNVNGPSSSLGATAAVAAPPADALNGCMAGDAQYGFDEAQGVVTPTSLNADDGVVIPSGTTVDSHMIFLNSHDAPITHANVVWEFKRPIIAVMSNLGGTLEAASSAALGARETNYSVSPSPNDPSCTGAAPFAGRGLDTTTDAPPYKHTVCSSASNNDCYSVSGNTITVTMRVVPALGDWIRVVTQGAQRVSIKVKSDGDRGCAKANGHQVFQVVIYGSAQFDVSKIDIPGLNFAGMSVFSGGGDEHGSEEQQCSLQDTNKDGFRDLTCKFMGETSGLSTGNPKLELKGSLQDGTEFAGSDTICAR